MKKLIAVLLAGCLLFGLSACDTRPATPDTPTAGDTERKNAEAKTALTNVLNAEESFTVYNEYTDETTTQSLDKFRYATLSNAFNVFNPFSYAFVDFDGDDIDELLVVDGDLSDFLFLKYEDGNVYGCVYSHISLQDIKTDGSFMTFQYQGFRAVSRISFSGTSYTITHKAYYDDTENRYLLDGRPASKNEVEDYFNTWNQQTTKITWTNMH